MRIRMHTVIAVAIAVFFTGCAQNAPYRTEYGLCTPTEQLKCAHSALLHEAPGSSREHYLGFVEFDDQGQLWDRAQMREVVGSYQEIAGQSDVLLVVFVHGWHHNAEAGDGNIEEFDKLLGSLAEIEARGGSGRKVLGLYVGWRGESIEIPLVNDLTFWERKNTAHNVGLQGVTEVLLRLEEIVNVKAGMETEEPPPLNSRMVVIGHSFGGAVLYTALQQVLADRFIDSRRGQTSSGDAKGFGDLVVLVNPAFEAMRFATLYDISQEHCRRYFETQLPKLAVLTSQGDLATKLAFPAGRFFSTLFETHKRLDNRHYCDGGRSVAPLTLDEGKADRTALGHFRPYITHELKPSAAKRMRGAGFDYRAFRTAWSRQQSGGTLPFVGSELVHLGRTHPLNPYLNVTVDKALMADHNDIWRPEIVKFVRDLITISTLPAE
jgi:hypothetical protein